MNEVRNVLVGFELGREQSQISYYDRRAGEPVQVPAKLGTNIFGFPTALAKLRGKDEWLFGREAVSAGEGWEIPENFYDLICGADPVKVDGQDRRPDELLAIYLQYALGLLGLRDALRSISYIMFTVEELTETLVRNLRMALYNIGFSQDQCGMQDYMESFYHYTFRQPEDFYLSNVALFLFSPESVELRLLVEDRSVHPRTVSVLKGASAPLPTEPKDRDDAFLTFVRKTISGHRISGVFFAGESFDPGWAERTIPYLLANRCRIFYGNNLYVKGACYAAMEKRERRVLRSRVYLSDSMVRTTVGMDLLFSGNPTYYPLISSGTSWFEAESRCEILVDGRDFLLFSLRSMDGKKRSSRQMPLPGLSNRPGFITRVRLTARCLSPDRCEIQAEDLGFGSFFPSTHRIWREELDLT